MKYMLLLLLLVIFLSVAFVESQNKVRADVINDPPIVDILDLMTGTSVDTLSANPGEVFTLVGSAHGKHPMIYQWYLDGTEVGENNFLLEYSITYLGVHQIILSVTDAVDLVGADTCYVEILESPIPVKSVSWGEIKSMYQFR